MVLGAPGVAGYSGSLGVRGYPSCPLLLLGLLQFLELLYSTGVLGSWLPRLLELVDSWSS